MATDSAPSPPPPQSESSAVARGGALEASGQAERSGGALEASGQAERSGGAPEASGHAERSGGKKPRGGPGRSAAVERLKQAAASAAAELVQEGMRVGLGTGSTVAPLLSALASRRLAGIRCVATSPATAERARELRLPLCTLEDLDGELDIAIDGADEVSPEGWLLKGGGGAHTREKIVALAARRFIVIVSEEKLVERLRPPVPLELLPFGLAATLRQVAPAKLRNLAPTPDGNLIADHLGPIDDDNDNDPALLANRLSAVPGVVEHGLFQPQLVSEVLVGARDGVRSLPGAKR